MSRTNSRERLLQAVMGELRALDGELDLMDQAIADRLGVNRTDAQCMDIITRSGPIAAGELAERVGLTAGAITSVLDHLERDGWIVRTHDPVDRRRVLVRHTSTNRALVQPIFGVLVRATREMLEQYSDDQLALIADFLRRTAAIAARHRQRLRAASRSHRRARRRVG